MDQTQKSKEFDRWSGMKLAERASTLDGLNQQGALVRQQVRDLQTAYRQKAGIEKEEEEDMGVQVGDNITYMQPPTPPVQQVSQPESTLKKALLYGGLLAAGAGTPMIVSKLMQDTPPAPVQNQVDRDTDTQYELRISTGDPK